MLPVRVFLCGNAFRFFQEKDLVLRGEPILIVQRMPVSRHEQLKGFDLDAMLHDERSRGERLRCVLGKDGDLAEVKHSPLVVVFIRRDKVRHDVRPGVTLRLPNEVQPCAVDATPVHPFASKARKDPVQWSGMLVHDLVREGVDDHIRRARKPAVLADDLDPSNLTGVQYCSSERFR